MKTIIAVPDFTRKAHLKRILPPLLKKLEKQGHTLRDIEIIIATGLHKAPTNAQIRQNLGNIPDKVKVSAHNYRKKYISYFGKTKKGIPLYLNKKLRRANGIITVGVVEPHLYAGYSGGTKVVAIGLAGEQTINATHHPRFLDHRDVRLCSIKGNPFRRFIDEVSALFPIKYSINIINDRNGNLLKVFEGNPQACFKKALNFSQKIFEEKIDRSFDIIICDIPKEKSRNLYQASRAFNYVANTKNPILKHNSLILVKARLEEGFGKGLGEKRFAKALLKIKDPKKAIKDIKKRGCRAGEHRAYMVAKAMLKSKLGFISKNCGVYQNKGHALLFFKNLTQAHNFIKKLFKAKARIYYLKNAFSTILIKNRS